MSDQPTRREMDLDAVADAISRKRGAGPLHLMDESSRGQYRAMARAALDTAARLIEGVLEDFPQQGRHTRARWATNRLRYIAEEER